jgi:hypothetical protein
LRQNNFIKVASRISGISHSFYSYEERENIHHFEENLENLLLEVNGKTEEEKIKSAIMCYWIKIFDIAGNNYKATLYIGNREINEEAKKLSEALKIELMRFAGNKKY